jgi:hypothetical protein
MIAITIQWDSKGKTTQVFGPEVDAKKQSQHIRKLKVEGLEDGIVLVEMWSRADGFKMVAKVSKSEVERIKKENEKAKKAFDAKNEKIKKDLIDEGNNKPKSTADYIADMKKANGAVEPVDKEPKKEK